jgi:hypothetical protein
MATATGIVTDRIVAEGCVAKCQIVTDRIVAEGCVAKCQIVTDRIVAEGCVAKCQIGFITVVTCNRLLNPLMPELNPSTQRCLTRFFYWGFCFLNRAFCYCMREKPTNATIIHSVY